MDNKKRILIISSLLLLPFTFGVFQFFPSIFGPKWGYVIGFLAYWIYAMLAVWLVSGSKKAYIKSMFNDSQEKKSTVIYQAAAFIPVFGVFFISFLPNAAQLTLTASLILILMAVINGIVEEVYWRGLYILEYKNEWLIGLVISPILFGAYHISLWFIKGLSYQGGFMALVGGAYVMGLLWAWVARKTGNIRACVIAHILVNLFAFTGLFVENGF